MSTLPEPRVVVAAIHPSGQPHIIDNVVNTVDAGSGFRVAQIFVQEEYEISDPTSVAEKGSKGTPHAKQDGGVSARYVDVAPKTDTFMHYTNTTDYLVMVTGELECEVHDGSRFKVKAGDTIVQLGNIHAWQNKTDQWARFMVIVIPSKPVEVNGKTLTDEPFNSTEMVY